MTDVTVRRATVDDAPAIAQVHLQTWRETYTGTLPADVIEGRPLAERAVALRRVIAGESRLGEQTLWVALQDGVIVGFAWAGSCRDPDRPDGLELYSINLVRDQHGTGAGQALLDAAVGAAPASLWVLEENSRARAFYERNGFTPDGSSKREEWLGGAHEIRMVR